MDDIAFEYNDDRFRGDNIDHELFHHHNGFGLQSILVHQRVELCREHPIDIMRPVTENDL